MVDVRISRMGRGASQAGLLLMLLGPVGILRVTDAPADARDGLWHALPGTPPRSHAGAASVYDSRRHRMIVIGGIEDGVLRNDVWQLPLGGEARWSPLEASGDAPSPRGGASAVYDSVRDRVLLFGGQLTYEDWSAELFELDLSSTPTWRALVPVGVAPPPRSHHAAVYDAKHDAMVVFGGEFRGNSLGNQLDDTWMLSFADGPPTWRQVVTPTRLGPVWRTRSGAAYDLNHDRMIIQGGVTWGHGQPNDAWTLSGAGAWTPLPIRGHNVPPVGATLTLDPVTGRVFMIGGSYFNDLSSPVNFVFGARVDSVMTILPPPLPYGNAPARAGHTTFYDPATDMLVVYGGWDGTHVLGDVLGFSIRSAWRWLGLKAPQLPRVDHASVLDPVRHRILVFGGSDGTTVHDDVWAMTLDDNTVKQWQKLSPVNAGPGPRIGLGAVYDRSHDRVLLFGGRDGVQAFDDLWELTLTPEVRWRQLTVADGPGNRAFFASALDTVRGRWIVFGGDADGDSTAPWALSLTDPPVWSRAGEPSRPGRPSPRMEAMSAYDPVSGRMLVYGGRGSDVYPGWAFDPTATNSWSPLPQSNAPPVSDSDVMVMDAQRQRVILGGADSLLWSLALAPMASDWTSQPVVDTARAARTHQTAIFDPIERRIVLWGGDGPETADTWALSVDDLPAWKELLPVAEGPGLVIYGQHTFYDARRDRMILVNRSGEVWSLALDGDTTWTRIAPTGDAPVPRDLPMVAHDPAHDRLLFGFGIAPVRHSSGEPMSDLWELTLGTSPMWRKLETKGVTPPASELVEAVVDTVTDRLIRTGGTDDDENLYYPSPWVLELRNSHWRDPGGQRPPSLVFPVFQLDAVHRRLFQFSGANYEDWPPQADLWMASLKHLDSWTIVQPSGTPPSWRLGVATAYDPDLDRLLMLGGGSYEEPGTAIFTLALEPLAWGRLYPAGSGPSLNGASAIYDPLRRRVVVCGGVQSGPWLWELRLPPVAASAVVTAAASPAPQFALEGFRTNPARSNLQVFYSLPDDAPARLELIDIAGRRVAERELRAAGPGVADLGEENPAPGVYVLRLTQGGRDLRRKCVVMR